MLPFFAIQRQWCIQIVCPKDPEFYTLLALNGGKGQHLSALEVYKNQSPNTSLLYCDCCDRPDIIARNCKAESALCPPSVVKRCRRMRARVLVHYVHSFEAFHVSADAHTISGSSFVIGHPSRSEVLSSARWCQLTGGLDAGHVMRIL